MCGPSLATGCSANSPGLPGAGSRRSSDRWAGDPSESSRYPSAEVSAGGSAAETGRPDRRSSPGSARLQRTFGRSRLAAAATAGRGRGRGQPSGDLPRVLCSGCAAALSDIGDYLPLPSLLGSTRAAAAAGAVGPATLAPPLAVAGAALAALATADDRPGAGGRPAGAAFAVELDHHAGAQGGVLLLPADPGGQLLLWAFPGREQPAVEGQERRVQPPGGRRRTGRAGW